MYYFHPQYRIHLERLQKVSLIWTAIAAASFRTQETHRPRVNVVFLVPSAPSLIISGLSQNIAFEFFMKSIVFYSVTFWIWNHTDQGPGCFKVVCNSGCLILSVERCITRDLCNTFFELNIWRRDGPSDHIPNWSSAILWACNYQRV